MKRLFIIIIVFFFYVIQMDAQSLHKFERIFVSDIKKLQNSDISFNWSKYDKYYKMSPINTIEYVKKYREDTAVRVRLYAYKFFMSAFRADTSVDHRKMLMDNIVIGLGDSSIVIENAVQAFLTFSNKKYFSTKAKAYISGILHSKAHPGTFLIKFVGFLDMKAEENYLIRQLDSSEFYLNEKWAANLALARLGNEEYARKCVEYVEEKPVNLRVVATLYKDLVYTRNRIALDFIVQKLLDNSYQCIATNPTINKKIDCGYRLMEIIAPAIKDYPYDYNYITGELYTDDYPEALTNIRKWFVNNPSYQIRYDNF